MKMSDMDRQKRFGTGSRGRLFGIICVVVLIKSVLAAITPLSGDFINIAYCAVWASQGGRFQGPYTFSVNLIGLFYQLWLAIPVDHQWIYLGYKFIASPSAFLLVFILKLPLLIADLLTALLIYRLVLLLRPDQRIARFALLAWLLNPYLTVIVEMDGTMDIVSTFLVVLACYHFIRGKYGFSGISLAVATVARFYPIVLFPLFIIILLRERKVRNLLVSIGSYLIPLALVLILLVARYGVGILNEIYKIPVGGNREFIWFFGFRPNAASGSEMEISSVMTILTILALLMLRVWKTDKALVLDAILITLLTFLGLSHFNRYYTIWVVPFLTLSLARNWSSSYRKAYAFLFALFFISASVYNFAYWWCSSLFFIYEFTPLISELTVLMRTLGGMLRLGDLGTTFSQSMLAAACIIYSTVVALLDTLRVRRENFLPQGWKRLCTRSAPGWEPT